MLHQDPWMADIDVNHWRNLQALLLESAKEKRRIILIHENGEILKFVHSQRSEIVRTVGRIDDPYEVAEKVYRANADRVDFVAVFERRAFDRYFGQFQDTWRAHEDLDVFVHRAYAMMDEYPDGIVTYPGPARTTLGLQWRVGASYDDIKRAVDEFVPPDSTVVFGVFKGDDLWATLVLGFDPDRRARVVTTVDPSEVTGGRWQAVAKDVVAWVNRRYPPCSLGLFMDLESTKAVLSGRDKLATLQDIAAQGNLIVEPIPPRLAQSLAAVEARR